MAAIFLTIGFNRGKGGAIQASGAAGSATVMAQYLPITDTSDYYFLLQVNEFCKIQLHVILSV